MKKIIIFLILLSIIFISGTIVFAKVPTDPVKPLKTFPNPLGSGDITIQVLIGKIINATLGIVGSLALLMFIYGGFTWMMASGNQQAVQKGKDILTWATVGLVVIFASYALVNFVLVAMTG